MLNFNLVRKAALAPLSVYVHIPFCVSKCPYCAFYSVRSERGRVDGFLEALEGELSWWKKCVDGSRLDLSTLYIGGGTPTMLSCDQWEKMLSLLDGVFTIGRECEISVEANPGTLTESHLALWKERGVKRISLGVQSLNPQELRWLHRPHTVDMAVEAIELSRKGGFEVSADLMFGLKGQDLRKWHNSLRAIVNSGINHISLYQLTLEPGTPWGDNPPVGVHNGYEHYRWAQWYLRKRGFEQYEIASFAKNGRWCKHNLAYWYRRNVIAIGPSAWGYLCGERYWNKGNLESYSDCIRRGISVVDGVETLTGFSAAAEAAVLALRTRWGINFDNFAGRYGQQNLEMIIGRLQEVPENCLRKYPGGISLSGKGMRVANAIWERII